MPNEAVAKRYTKLLSKLKSWSPASPEDPLIPSHELLVADASSLPAPSGLTDADVPIVEEFLKKIEAFMRQVQVALGLGREVGKEHIKLNEPAAKNRTQNANETGKVKDKKSKEKSKHLDEEEKQSSEEKEMSHAVSSSGKEPSSLPEFIAHRVAVWDAVMGKPEQEKMPLPQAEISVTLPDGKTVSGTAGVTTPYMIAKQISNSLAERVVVAKINDAQVIDVNAPLTASCQLSLLDFESTEGRHTFWHSSAHLLGQAMEMQYRDLRLCVGPPLEDGGFYYDAEMGDQKVSPHDYKELEKKVEKIIKERQPFIRLVLTRDEALEMFKFNPFKLEIIRSKVPVGATCTAYRCGPLIDLCKGPHVPHSGVIKALAVTKSSSSYWLAKAENASLQRVYGISFPNKKKLEEWEEFMEMAAKRDHRKLGESQKLFFFHEWSPGSCFFLPHGARIYNKLIEFIRNEYKLRGYSEVISPNVFNIELWKKSGHYANYKDNMFLFECENVEFGMKPMNCPGHCLMFASHLHSYRELPIRFADFGVLHRNEISGSLTGLTRVRRFQQDDAHIFCRQDQIEDEVRGVLDMLESVYGVFGFEYSLALSTRPDKYLGEVQVWDQAEQALTKCLDAFVAMKNQKLAEAASSKGNAEAANGGERKEMKWSINAGDGAFYGPKIDIQLTDALNRRHQCATIQLDFQLPLRFELNYKTEEGVMERPVIIHRAILGSVERMLAVLIEHTGGKWPFWLSPRQIMIVPTTASLNGYGNKVRQLLHDDGYYVDIDESNDTMKRKILNAHELQYNLILVVGGKEEADSTVTVRPRDQATEQQVVDLDKFRANCKMLVQQCK